MEAELGQYQLVADVETPIVGKDVQFSASIVRHYGLALVWPVIPGEYFYTVETEPQVKVDVEGMPALCTGMACNFAYSESASVIQAFSRSGTALTILGADLETPESVVMGHIECTGIAVAEVVNGEVTQD